MTALELLLTADAAAAQRLAQEADRTNLQRRQADQTLKDEAIRMARPFLERGDPGLVLASPDWHKGLIGIGASRLVERFQVPAVLFAVEGDEARGSARSVANIDVKAVLDRCAGLLVRYGGHAQAAGMTLRTRDIEAFRRAFLSSLAVAPPGGPVPKVYDLDLPLPVMSAGSLTDLMKEIEQLEPFGVGNGKPIFRCRSLRLLRPPQLMGNGSHLRFAFRDSTAAGAPQGAALGREFVAFNSTDSWQQWLAEQRVSEGEILSQHWDILFQINRNTYRPHGDVYDPVQQLLVDLRPAVDQ
jgi:single-stranded-DNA-specific exonuclease